MNQVFSFKRYWWLVKRQWYENAAIYKWGIVLMALATGMLFWMFSDWITADKYFENHPISSSNPYPHLGQELTFTIMGVFMLCIFGGWFFDSLTSKQKKIFNFSLPVLPLERIAVAFTSVMIVMPVLLLTIFSAFDFIFVQIFNHIHGTSVQMFFIDDSHFINTGRISGLLSLLSLTSIFTLGSLIFGKKGPAISIIFIIIMLYLINTLVIKNFIIARSHDTYIMMNSHFILLISLCWLMMFFVMKKKEA